MTDQCRAHTPKRFSTSLLQIGVSPSQRSTVKTWAGKQIGPQAVHPCMIFRGEGSIRPITGERTLTTWMLVGSTNGPRRGSMVPTNMRCRAGEVGDLNVHLACRPRHVESGKRLCSGSSIGSVHLALTIGCSSCHGACGALFSSTLAALGIPLEWVNGWARALMIDSEKQWGGCISLDGLPQGSP